MKNILITFTLFFVVGISQLFAQLEPPKFEPISKYDLECYDGGAAFFFNFEDKKVWQADHEETQGLLLAITDFASKNGKKPSYDISGYLDIFGSKMNYNFSIATKNNTTKMVMKIKTDEGTETKQFDQCVTP